MERNTRTGTIIVIVIALLAAIGLFGYWWVNNSDAPARAAASGFVDQQKSVSLLAPDASSTMAAAYGTYVAPSLLAAWQADPRHAPGRLTSSPWPDHLVVVHVAPQGSGYVVSGDIVLMTSSGQAGTIPVIMQVVKDPASGTWQIVAYQEQATSTAQ